MPSPLFPSEYQREWSVSVDHAAIAADTALPGIVVPAGRIYRLVSAQYINPTGLAGNASNFVNIIARKNALTAFNWSTDTGQQGSIAADTWVDLIKTGTDANLVLVAGDRLNVFVDATGTVTLPAGGRLVVNLLRVA